ncbi:hypothetical protein, partial [Rhizobium leguminosarum]|uniref:hypothetical protein n=1 Tax=Rhizobium leguminosarum TaxID=384 RepID=UPI003F9CF0AF
SESGERRERDEEREGGAVRDEQSEEKRRRGGAVAIELGATPAASLPTDQRIAGFAGGDDPALEALDV